MAYLLSLGLALALNVAANPMPIPAVDLPVSDYPPNCTTWLTSTVRGFTGGFTAEIEETIYTSTETSFYHVPCDGCTLSITTVLSPIFGGVGPAEIITGTTTAKTATTVTSTVCSPEYRKLARRTSAAPTSTAASASASGCTYTQDVAAETTFGPVRTVWTTTDVVTSHVNCTGCSHIATKVLDFLNPGPVVIFNSTTTVATPSKTTTYVCKKTDKA